MLRVAIIGAGRIGRVHAESVASHPKATLVAVCDPMGTAAEDLVAVYGAKAYKDVADVFASDTEVDAVIVSPPRRCTPSGVLGDPLRQGCPRGEARREGRRGGPRAGRRTRHVRAPARHGRLPAPLRPVDSWREGPVDAGKIGDVEQVRIVARDPSAPLKVLRRGLGGLFKDMSIHDFDEARFFRDIEEVVAFGQQTPPELKDTGDFDAAMDPAGNGKNGNRHVDHEPASLRHGATTSASRSTA